MLLRQNIANIFPLKKAFLKENANSIVIKRWKKKIKPNKKLNKAKSLLPTEQALHYFDTYYKPVYGDLWPSIRVSLLSGQKYGALVNNYCQNDVGRFLQELGAEDMIKKAKKCEVIQDLPETRIPEVEHLHYESDHERNSIRLSDMDSIDPIIRKDYDLHNFVPVERVYTSRELRLQEENKAAMYVDNMVDAPISKENNISILEDLKVFTYKPGDVSDFPRPKSDSANLLGYYLLDASSILPVLALDIKTGDSILDLCAAPGGKSLTILQSLIPVQLQSNDISSSRLNRLRSILRHYIPYSQQSVQLSCQDAVKLRALSFDKVLVDVPCNCDRISLLVDNNNIFSPAREKQRLKMAALQKEILVSGIKLCKPGGSIVYSTCTLSPPQNDGVIQAALEDIQQNTPMDVEIADISFLSHQLKDTFTFFKGSRFGQLVIPSLTKNFGPMYIAKLNRLN